MSCSKEERGFGSCRSSNFPFPNPPLPFSLLIHFYFNWGHLPACFVQFTYFVLTRCLGIRKNGTRKTMDIAPFFRLFRLCYLGPIYFTNHIFSWYRRPFSTSSQCPSGQTHQFIPLLLFSVLYRHILAAYPSFRQRILLSGRQCSWMAAHIFRLLLQDSLLGLLFLKHPVLSLLTDL